jgi:hypothetical protein
MQGMTPQTAPQQTPQGVAGLQAPQGVAALPSGMGPQSFAGGGIVAFSGKDDSLVAAPEGNLDPSTYDNMSEKPGRKFDRELLENIKNIPGAISDKFKEWNTPWSQTVSQTTPNGAQAVMSGKIPKGSLPPPAEAQPNLPATINATPTAAEVNALQKNGPQDAKVNPTSVGTGAGADTGAGAKTSAGAGTKASDAAAQLGVKQTDSASDIFGKYQKMYDEQKAQAGADKEQAKWMRLLEAGLGIMGGTSPFAAVNIGQGATGAVKGYAQDVAGMRKEQSEANKELALIGMKQAEIKNDADKTGITAQHYQDWARLEQQKNGILAANGASSRAGIAEENRVLNAYKILSAKPENMGKSEQELYSMARTMVTGQNQDGGSSTVQWSSLGTKK